MDNDDPPPKNQKPPLKNLDIMSIDALLDYIAGLEAEMARARKAIAAKEKARDAAHFAFKR